MTDASFSPATRVAGITPFLAMEVLERAQAMQRAGADIIHLEVGEPDFDTPPCIVAAGKQALDQGHTHYTASQGDQELRVAIADHYLRRYGVRVHEERILLFPGTSPAMMVLFSALLNPGDEVILSNPAYACYPNFVRFAGGVAREVLTHEEEGFQYRPEDVARAITPRTRAVMVNSPCNPTGIVLEAQRMRALGDLCAGAQDAAHAPGMPRGAQPLIISDEIYHGLTYEGPEHSMLEFTDNAVIIGGFSKAFAMTGWRLGYLVVPQALVRPLHVLMQNFFISPNAAVQRAALAALRHADADVARMRAVYDERRRFLLDALRGMGFHIPVEPRGAFYMLINARHLARAFGGDSVKLAFDILEKAHIGVTPGVDFGSQTEGFLRLSYASSLENLREAMARLQRYIHTHHNAG